ncbi:IS66 family insertion sequence element accessory protein TnpA [Evansella cellulosilytica]|uniref:IS66 family insertion sequence element accessory protein TnpB n=1 Tax=Evansella cellulosilytica (strain ATCC 21833 / DSM 2522 / FERM P-1141 / JCM 9156 / N-4) TaxID=649639 RepID=E6TVL1_EVAC2|nr:hypothetical protein [Evansella cellulosilytica]ADU32139.1 hypothetical protein Bcell_3902 [Evansella cellulosilytica DSM 2522]
MSVKEIEWNKRMEQWRDSGLSMAAWCRQEEVNIHQMYYWKRKFDQSSEENQPPIEWINISHSNDEGFETPLYITVDHLSIEVRPTVDRRLLSDVLNLLR